MLLVHGRADGCMCLLLPAPLVGCGLFHPAHAELSFMVKMGPEKNAPPH